MEKMLNVKSATRIAIKIVFVCLFCSNNLFAQQTQITGTITSADSKMPLMGVSVSIRGHNRGAVTDIKGKYSINALSTDSLVFSFIGYETLSQVIGNRQIINIELLSSSNKLNDVVIIGYGTQKKGNLTGSVATISGEDMVKRPVVNTTSMLQGLAPGVAVTQSTGEPGNEGVSIKIRGNGTFSGAGSDPLVLVDDVPGNLNDVNPSDIESVTVLKDAATAAIYGSRGANGVILVTTKKGKAGKLRVQYDGNIGIYKPTKLFKVVTNSVQYMEMYNQARINSGLTDSSLLYSQEDINDYVSHPNDPEYPNTDWLPLLFHTSPTHVHNISFNGGNDKTTYNVSVGYADENGIMRGFNYKKYNIRSNIVSRVNDHIQFGTNILLKSGVTEATSNGSEDMFLSTLSQAPTYGPYTADGSGHLTYKAYSFEYNNKNPLGVLDQGLYHNTHDYEADIQGWLNVSFTKDLSWYTKVAFNGEFDNYKNFVENIPQYYYRSDEFVGYTDLGQGLTVQDEHTLYSNVFSYLKYQHSFGSHNITAQVGYSLEQSKYEYLQANRKNYIDPDLQEINAWSNDVIGNAGTSNQWALASWFGRVEYNYKDRYLLSSNIRLDGSSKFAPDHRWGAFPSIQGGWHLSEEPFFKNLNANWINNIKFRGSWGHVGNQNIVINGYGQNYPWQPLLSITGAYSFDNQNLLTGVAQTQLNNLALQWETTSMTDVGADITLLNNFNVTFDWYNRTTSDILRQSQITAVVGMGAPTINEGTVNNRGIELGLAYHNAVNDGTFKGLNYNLGINLDHNANKLVKYGAPDIGGYTINKQGYPINSFYMLQVIGIFQTADEVANSPKQYGDQTQPGDLKFKDANGDGKVDDNDRMIVSGAVPKLNYSITGSVNWKGFDLSILLQGVYGVKYFVNNWGTIPFVQGAPPTTDWLNAWTPEHPSTKMPRLYWGWSAPSAITRSSTYFLQSGSYMRIKNINFGYTLPAKLTEHIGIERFRIYFSGDNLFTFTKYRGLDPERGGSGDFLTYPQNKIYSFGVNVTF